MSHQRGDRWGQHSIIVLSKFKIKTNTWREAVSENLSNPCQTSMTCPTKSSYPIFPFLFVPLLPTPHFFFFRFFFFPPSLSIVFFFILKCGSCHHLTNKEYHNTWLSLHPFPFSNHYSFHLPLIPLYTNTMNVKPSLCFWQHFTLG